MHAKRAILAFGLLLTASRARAQAIPGANHPVNDLAGCYRLTLGPWSKVTPLGPSSLTEIFRLDTTSVANGIPSARAAARLAPTDSLSSGNVRGRRLRPPFWRRIGSDSVV